MIYGSLGILGILVATALVAPLLWDINDYKPQILIKAKEILKREVSIEGKLSLSLLPTPRISAPHVSIANLPGGSPRDFIHIRQVKVCFSLLPLLTKHIEINKIDLDSPEIFLQKLDNGQANWSFTSAEQTSSSSMQDMPPPAAQQFGFTLHKIKISNGHLVYHQEGKNTDIREINMTAALDLLQDSYIAVGTLNAFGEDIRIQSHIKTLGATQEVDLEMQGRDIMITLKGQSLFSSLTFNGTLAATAHPEIVRNLLQVKWPLILSKPLQINATIAANSDRVSFDPIKLDAGDTQSTGELNVFFKNGLRLESAFKGLPGHSYCQLSLLQSPKGLLGSVKLEVRHAKDLLKWLKIETETIPVGLLEGFVFSTQYRLTDAMRLENLNLIIQDAKLRGAISWQMMGGFPVVTMDLEAPKADAIFKVLDVKVPQILRTGSGSFHGKIFGDLNTLNLDTKISLGEVGLTLKGMVSSFQKDPEFNLRMGVSHPNLHRLLGKRDSPTHGSARGLSVYSHLQGNKTYFKAMDLKGKLGSDIHFSGNMSVDSRGVKPHIKASLSTNTLNADILLATASQEVKPHSAVAKIHLVAAKRRNSPSHSKWPCEPLDFSYLSMFDGQLDLTVLHFVGKDIAISNLKLIAKIQNSRLDIPSLTGRIYDGNFKGSGYLTANNVLQFNASIKDANLANFLALPGKIKIVGGKLSLSSNFSTHGHNVEEMVQHLAGLVSVQAKDGIISGFDLHALSHSLTSLKDVQSFMGLLGATMQNGKTFFSSFKSDVTFKEGIGIIQLMNLIAKGGQGHASGYIDLPRYALDVRTEFRLTEHPNFPAFHMRLTGDLDNPSRELDTSVLQKYMMENVFKNVVKQLGKNMLGVPDILGGILGGKGIP